MMVASPDESRFSSSVVRHLLPQANTDGAFLFPVRAGQSQRQQLMCPLLTYLSRHRMAHTHDTRIGGKLSTDIYSNVGNCIPAALVDDLDGENPPD